MCVWTLNCQNCPARKALGPFALRLRKEFSITDGHQFIPCPCFLVRMDQRSFIRHAEW